jgi:hypothetical protein
LEFSNFNLYISWLHSPSEVLHAVREALHDRSCKFSRSFSAFNELTVSFNALIVFSASASSRESFIDARTSSAGRGFTAGLSL